MADTFKVLYQGQAATATAALYTVPASTSAIIRHIRCVNASTSATASVTLYVGGSADSNMILNTTTLAAAGVLEMDVFLTLEAAKTLQGKASAATTVTISVFGVEIT